MCLKIANDLFEVIIFTASRKEYADAMIDYIDKEKKYVHHRVYRDSCVYTNGLYIKDLRVLNRDMKKMVIVDNAVISFGFQLENGIPVLPFYDDKRDDCLYKIAMYLKYLNCVADMRFANNEKFCLLELKDLEFTQYLDYYISDEDEEGSESPSSHETSPIKNEQSTLSTSVINLHKVGEALDAMSPGTPSRKMSVTKKHEKVIDENLNIIHKCLNTMYKSADDS